ncbi:unnamed protein product [Ectocarpus sp. 8 AP-2014]
MPPPADAGATFRCEEIPPAAPPAKETKAPETRAASTEVAAPAGAPTLAATQEAAAMSAAARLVLEMSAFCSPTSGSKQHLNAQPHEEWMTSAGTPIGTENFLLHQDAIVKVPQGRQLTTMTSTTGQDLAQRRLLGVEISRQGNGATRTYALHKGAAGVRDVCGLESEDGKLRLCTNIDVRGGVPRPLCRRSCAPTIKYDCFANSPALSRGL